MGSSGTFILASASRMRLQRVHLGLPRQVLTAEHATLGLPVAVACLSLHLLVTLLQTHAAAAAAAAAADSAPSAGSRGSAAV
jgi:hypothetical protein